jgi:integral membrane sensor domain MASE1
MSNNAIYGACMGFLGLPLLCFGLFHVLASMRLPENAFGNDISTESIVTILYLGGYVAPFLGAIIGAVIGAAMDKPPKSDKTHPQESVFTGLNADR